MNGLAELGLVLPEIPATPFTPRLRPVAVQGDIALGDLPPTEYEMINYRTDNTPILSAT